MGAQEIDSAVRLKGYIERLAEWALVVAGEPYDHMGAVICDAGLQAGINYQYVVWPRIKRLLAMYPEARTTSEFLDLLNNHGPEKLIEWNGAKKAATIRSLAELLARHGVETTDQLRSWLLEPGNLTHLSTISGIGPKTLDYIQILVGIQTVAVDVHLRNFVRQAGIAVDSYTDARDLISRTADLMGVDWAVLDHSIWAYMSQMKTIDQPPSSSSA